jgi:uncharacterized DUF497 family protein
MDFSAFDWDEGNREKCQKHGVSRSAIESMFTGAGVAILPDAAHSQQEQRFRAIGRTRAGRTIFVVFTLRHIGGDADSPNQRPLYAHEGGAGL